MKRVIVGLSGGVDSAVSALLLKQQGFQVEGLFMKNWEEDDNDTHCPTQQDIQDAEQVCQKLNIPFHTVNFSNEYWESVFEYFLSEYRAGRTPNPDILCNREIKFKAFLDYALQLGADYIATGHYAKKAANKDQFELVKGDDANKDQSYFLYTLGQYPLSKALFPIGHLEKPAVRKLAEQMHLPNFNKKDSTGICFIGERKFKTFLNRYIPAKPGLIETPEHEVLGQHDGLMFYTLGQRQGLKIGGQKNHSTDPWYVVAKDLSRNVLVVAQGEDHPLLYTQALKADQLHWVTGTPPATRFECSAKVRYRQSDQPCLVEIDQDNHCLVTFTQPQRAVTPGQSVVFYQQNSCLGGGIIQ
jgi:tRNA-specific 2-thiouridylase